MLAEGIQVKSENFKKLAVNQNIQFFRCLAKVQHCFSKFNAFLMIFSRTFNWKAVYKVCNLQSPMILHQSLLFITITTNDMQKILH